MHKMLQDVYIVLIGQQFYHCGVQRQCFLAVKSNMSLTVLTLIVEFSQGWCRNDTLPSAKLASPDSLTLISHLLFF